MVTRRVQAVQNALQTGEAFLVTSDVNRFYYTGFRSSAGAVLLTRDDATLLIDFRYFEKAKREVSSCTVKLSQNQTADVQEWVRQHGVHRLYIEVNRTTVGRFVALTSALEGVEVSKSDKLDAFTDKMRSIKTAEEIALIQQAQKYTDATFAYILDRIEVGRTELEVMLDMEFHMRQMGSEGVSFDFIVVSGQNTSLPHGVPTDKKIVRGDLITMDFGAVYQGYRSDMTRTVAVGEVNEEQLRVYETVLQAQLVAEQAVRAGVVCKDVDKVARDLINEAGYEGCFGHGLGHGVGIEIHENPSFNTRCETVLQPGMILTNEPGIYLEGKFGVRIEDMLCVTDDGCLNMTSSDKRLIVL